MTNNPFYAVSIQNRTGKPVEFQIQPDQGPIPDQAPVLLASGSFQIPMIQPQDDARHIALGRFMDHWSKLEMQIGRLLGLAMNTPHDDIPVVMNALGSRGQRECLEALLLPRLQDAAVEKLRRLLTAFKNNATKRNSLAHGYWHLEVVITERNSVPWPNYRQYRRYNPSDASVRKALDQRTDPKARKTHMFSVARINALSSDLDRLWHEFSKIGASDLKEGKKQPADFKITNGSTTAGFGAQPVTNGPAHGSGKGPSG